MPYPKITKAQVAAIMLGRSCKHCGDIDGPFDLDHIVPQWTYREPDDRLTKGMIMKLNYKAMKAELRNCQLLCRPCHRIKTTKDLAECNAYKRDIKEWLPNLIQELANDLTTMNPERRKQWNLQSSSRY